MILGLKPISFSSIEHFGDTGIDISSTEYYLSKLLVQNVLFSAYTKPQSIEEIALNLDIPHYLAKEVIDYLEANALVKETAQKKYITCMLLHDITIDIRKKMQSLYKKYSSIICEEYIPSIIDSALYLKNNKIYIPEQDINYYLWTMITFTYKKKVFFQDTLNNLKQHYIRRNDGGNYISSAIIEAEDPLQVNLHGVINSFRIRGENQIRINRYDNSPLLWVYNTKYDDRFYDGFSTLAREFKETYEYMKNYQVDNTTIERLLNKGFLVKNKKPDLSKTNIYVNILVSKITIDEMLHNLPNMPDSFYRLNYDLALDLFNLCKSQYPPHLQDFASDYYNMALDSSDMIFYIFNSLIKIGVIQPLLDFQKKTVNLIIFGDVLPTN